MGDERVVVSCVSYRCRSLKNDIGRRVHRLHRLVIMIPNPAKKGEHYLQNPTWNTLAARVSIRDGTPTHNDMLSRPILVQKFTPIIPVQGLPWTSGKATARAIIRALSVYHIG